MIEMKITPLDVEKMLEEAKKLWESFPISKKAPVFEMVNRELSDKVKNDIRGAIEKNPKEWWTQYHFGWGMGFRNLLREKKFGEEYWGVDNIDDIYVHIIEESLGLYHLVSPNPFHEKSASDVNQAEQKMCYVATCRKCGGWSGAVSDDKAIIDEVADAVSRWIKYGFAINRVEMRKFKDPSFPMCICHKDKQRKMF